MVSSLSSTSSSTDVPSTVSPQLQFVQHSPSRHDYDIVIVGTGIVGLATAREVLRRYPHVRLVMLEKEATIASHQTGHNSGVIHSGIYYKPGSLKAKSCVAGHREMIQFCDEHRIPYKLCGKLIVALDQSELPRLHDLYARGTANGVQQLELIDPERMREIEPYAAGIKAIYSPQTGIIDYKKVAEAYAAEIIQCGGEIVTNSKVLRLDMGPQNSVLITQNYEVEARYVITCAGLYSDKISRTQGEQNPLKIVPFRGSYYKLTEQASAKVNALIYPVPDPSFPFLGVHFTRLLNDDVWVGPNAVLAFAREGYQRWTINVPELAEILAYKGFWKLAGRYWQQGLREMYQDYVKSAYIKTAQRYLPSLSPQDFIAGPSGVRAQALDGDGNLVDDFAIKRVNQVIHIQNAPSPAATSSLVIARMIVDEVPLIEI